MNRSIIVAGMGAATLAALAGCGRAAAMAAPTTAPSASTTSSTPVIGNATPPAASPTAATSPAAPTTCRLAHLDVSLTGGDAGLGHRSRILVFRNTGSVTCVLRGYPGVAAADAAGHQVAQAKRTLHGYMGGVQSGQPTLVQVAPGASVSATVEGLAFDTVTGDHCTGYDNLVVTPPDETRSVTLGWDNAACGDFQIHPVVPGTTGQSR